jgi:hypothetical protein
MWSERGGVRSRGYAEADRWRPHDLYEEEDELYAHIRVIAESSERLDPARRERIRKRVHALRVRRGGSHPASGPDTGGAPLFESHAGRGPAPTMTTQSPARRRSGELTDRHNRFRTGSLPAHARPSGPPYPLVSVDPCSSEAAIGTAVELRCLGRVVSITDHRGNSISAIDIEFERRRPRSRKVTGGAQWAPRRSCLSVDPGLRYLMLVLRLRKLEPSLVESYVGPAELAARIDSEPAGSPLELREQARELRAGLAHEALDPGRRRWLSGQLSALETALGWLAGEALSYRELFERCHGVAPTLASETRFEAAHRLLDQALPGRGELSRRYQRWAASQLVPRDRLMPGLSALAAELRSRTRERFGLPDGEHVAFELVNGKPWSGYADYAGALRTRIQINLDLPIRAFWLLELVAHEAYPGHHSEHVCKDVELIRARGRLELSVYAYPTPQALLAEGLATYALHALLGDEADAIAAECLRSHGIAYDAEVAAVVRRARSALLPVSANVAIMRDEGDMFAGEAQEYVRHWTLESDSFARKVVGSLQERRWKPYESCYPEGLDFCRRFAGDDPRRFVRLLREQLTTLDLT